jgi:hypothetical protein
MEISRRSPNEEESGRDRCPAGSDAKGPAIALYVSAKGGQDELGAKRPLDS